MRPDSYFAVIWAAVHCTCAIGSSYLYAWFAAFGNQQRENYFWPTFDYDITLLLEIFFTISIILKFITGYVPEGHNHMIGDHGKIAMRYIYSNFPIDFITWIPFWLFLDNSKGKFWRLFYLVKVLRMFN